MSPLQCCASPRISNVKLTQWLAPTFLLPRLGLVSKYSMNHSPAHPRDDFRLKPLSQYSAAHSQRHAFSTSFHKQKASGGKQNSKSNLHRANQITSHKGNDPFDFTAFKSEVENLQSQLRDELSQIRAGGRDINGIESIRVRLTSSSSSSSTASNGEHRGGGGKKDAGETTRLGDLASIVPRGRNLVIMVHEQVHVKPITAALSSTTDADGGTLAPQSSSSPESDPLHLMVPIPPVTRDSRQRAANTATERGNTTLVKLRDARRSQSKKLRAIELESNQKQRSDSSRSDIRRERNSRGDAGEGRKVSKDELFKAEKEMEKISEAGNEVVKKIVLDAKKRLLEGGG